MLHFLLIGKSMKSKQLKIGLSFRRQSSTETNLMQNASKCLVPAETTRIYLMSKPADERIFCLFMPKYALVVLVGVFHLRR